MKCRIVSSRLPIKAHPTHTYKYIENMDNHRNLIPGVSDWQADKNTARYSCRLGLGRVKLETQLTERMVGGRVCEEPVQGSPFPYKRWIKIQADEQACIVEIAMECDMTTMQKILYTPALKAQMEQMLRNLKAVMEKPKEKPAPAPSPAVPPPTA